MSEIVSVTESNCQARTLVGRHRAWTRGVLWTARDRLPHRGAPILSDTELVSNDSLGCIGVR